MPFYCASLFQMQKDLFFFSFCTGIAQSTGYYHSHQLIKQPQLPERQVPFHRQVFTQTPAGTSTDKQAQNPSSLSQGPISSLTN